MFSAFYAIYEEAGISMTVLLRRREPLVGSIRIFWNTLAHEVELTQEVLCMGAAIVRRLPQIRCRRFRVLCYVFSADVFLAKPIGGVYVLPFSAARFNQ